MTFESILLVDPKSTVFLLNTPPKQDGSRELSTCSLRCCVRRVSLKWPDENAILRLACGRQFGDVLKHFGCGAQFHLRELPGSLVGVMSLCFNPNKTVSKNLAVYPPPVAQRPLGRDRSSAHDPDFGPTWTDPSQSGSVSLETICGSVLPSKSSQAHQPEFGVDPGNLFPPPAFQIKPQV